MKKAKIVIKVKQKGADAFAAQAEVLMDGDGLCVEVGLATAIVNMLMHNKSEIPVMDHWAKFSKAIYQILKEVGEA